MMKAVICPGRVTGPACPYCGSFTEPGHGYRQYHGDGDDDHGGYVSDLSRWRWECNCGFSSPWGTSGGRGFTNKETHLIQASLKMEGVL